MPAEELVRERAKNSIHSSSRNTVLALLRKPLKDFTSLTIRDKQLKLKLYELRQGVDRLSSLKRAPLIFPVAREFESNHSRFKKLTYKSISIIFD